MRLMPQLRFRFARPRRVLAIGSVDRLISRRRIVLRLIIDHLSALLVFAGRIGGLSNRSIGVILGSKLLLFLVLGLVDPAARHALELQRAARGGRVFLAHASGCVSSPSPHGGTRIFNFVEMRLASDGHSKVACLPRTGPRLSANAIGVGKIEIAGTDFPSIPGVTLGPTR